MDIGFHDHPRKKIVREKWNTPLLRFLYQKWNMKFFYCGLPGPEAIDIVLWQDMIKKVVAFEIECNGEDIRKNIVALNYRLTTLQVPYEVFVGPLEDVMLRGLDHDGKTFILDELVTLYNLDFCNPITGKVVTQKGRHCLRFEALREITALQRRLFRKSGADKFVILLTVFNAFHDAPVRERLRDPDLPEATREFARRAGKALAVNRERTIFRNTEVLKAFMFTCIRGYLQGQNVVSVFLPPVSYIGTTKKSPMLHFAVVCKMGPEGTSLALESQSASDFLSLAILDVSEGGVTASDKQGHDMRVELDPASFINKFPSII